MLPSINLISVIIPTYNSAKTLYNCLYSIKNQNYKNIEIIVIDNFSIDNTKNIALEFTNNFFTKWEERSKQKNYGITKANWKYVIFIDSDMIIPKNLFKNCINIFDINTKVWWICINEKSIWNKYFSNIRNYEKSFYNWSNIESARFFKLDNVKKVWWFNDNLVFFEESILPQKIEKQLWLSCKFKVYDEILHDESNINIFKWLLKKYYYWKNISKYKSVIKVLWNDKTLYSQIWIINRYKIFFLNKNFYKHPILSINLVLFKTIEFIYWLFGLILYKIKNIWKK